MEKRETFWVRHSAAAAAATTKDGRRKVGDLALSNDCVSSGKKHSHCACLLWGELGDEWGHIGEFVGARQLIMYGDMAVVVVAHIFQSHR
jgi:hypothetical protein